ncbi:olfactory receptor 2G3-like [Tachyglossus aculeatus]|uniref:olfactory receptor 2G3-like n=1 Tax=Tachyglossus aculeatus TaxID=9261 RepID=UPI0018F550CA|nr:olfactory receptor 2G3-like [Tachyglossus aculeatus]
MMPNDTSGEAFVLVGFSAQPQLEKILFMVVLIFDLLTLVGKMAIILVTRLDLRLHTPMYVFLSQLSHMYLCFTTSIVPQLLWNIRGHSKTTTLVHCAVQLYMSPAPGSTECIPLVIMTLDHHAAICRPLHYTTIMHPRLCWALVGLAWLGRVGDTAIQVTVIYHLPRYVHQRLSHFLCEMLTMLKLACVDVRANEIQLFVDTLALTLLPFNLITVSYGSNTRAMLRIYISFSGTLDKFLTVFFTVATPTLNPLIYTLRNKDEASSGFEEKRKRMDGISMSFGTAVLFQITIRTLVNVLLLVFYIRMVSINPKFSYLGLIFSHLTLANTMIPHPRNSGDPVSLGMEKFPE